jgi:hypothetical protein
MNFFCVPQNEKTAWRAWSMMWIGLLAAFLAAGSRAQDENGDAATTPANEVEIDMSEPEEPRDPFWPVSYSPVVEQPVVATNAVATNTVGPAVSSRFKDLPKEKQDAIRGKIQIGGVLKQGAQYVALINKQMVGQGDKIAVQADGNTYFFVVRKLTEQDVSLEPLDEGPQSP